MLACVSSHRIALSSNAFVPASAFSVNPHTISLTLPALHSIELTADKGTLASHGALSPSSV
jgi:hypothetical protein